MDEIIREFDFIYRQAVVSHDPEAIGRLFGIAMTMHVLGYWDDAYYENVRKCIYCINT